MIYEKIETVEKYGTVLQEDKSVVYREQVAKSLWRMLQESPYTYGELLECLGWEDWKLRRILSGDEEVGIYELTHITGALGFDFNISYTKQKENIGMSNVLNSFDMCKLF